MTSDSIHFFRRFPMQIDHDEQQKGRGDNTCQPRLDPKTTLAHFHLDLRKKAREFCPITLYSFTILDLQHIRSVDFLGAFDKPQKTHDVRPKIRQAMKIKEARDFSGNERQPEQHGAQPEKSNGKRGEDTGKHLRNAGVRPIRRQDRGNVDDDIAREPSARHACVLIAEGMLGAEGLKIG